MTDGAGVAPFYIAPARADHIEAMARAHAVCFEQARWGQEQIAASLALETTRGWSAFAQDRLAGFLLCQLVGPEMEILTFCVLPAFQRHGIGAGLLAQAAQALPGAGRMFLEVAEDNAPARRLYEKMGFVRVGARKGYYRRGQTCVDGLCYCLTIEARGDKLGFSGARL